MKEPTALNTKDTKDTKEKPSFVSFVFSQRWYQR
jgi:hypothetical protein